MPKAWKKGRGKLGFLEPLLGEWTAEATTPMGPVRCLRTFTNVLGGTRIRLDARWEVGPGRAYEELALIGTGDDGTVCFWSFTSDGKRSQGVTTDVTDVHLEAIGFEAKMPAGIARMIYWPADDGGFHWAVESMNKKGWHRFTEHHYRRAPAPKPGR
jgi:hypothetical protein